MMMYQVMDAPPNPRDFDLSAATKELIQQLPELILRKRTWPLPRPGFKEAKAVADRIVEAAHARHGPLLYLSEVLRGDLPSSRTSTGSRIGEMGAAMRRLATTDPVTARHVVAVMGNHHVRGRQVDKTAFAVNFVALGCETLQSLMGQDVESTLCVWRMAARHHFRGDITAFGFGFASKLLIAAKSTYPSTRGTLARLCRMHLGQTLLTIERCTYLTREEVDQVAHLVTETDRGHYIDENAGNPGDVPKPRSRCSAYALYAPLVYGIDFSELVSITFARPDYQWPGCERRPRHRDERDMTHITSHREQVMEAVIETFDEPKSPLSRSLSALVGGYLFSKL